MSIQSSVIHVGSRENVGDSKPLLVPSSKGEDTKETLTEVEATEKTHDISDVNKNDCITPEQPGKEKLSDSDNGNTQNGEKTQGDWTKPFKRRSSIENFGRFGLLTPALVLVPQIDGNDALTQRFPALQGENRELILAAAHIDDAINGRGRYGKARAIFKSKKGQTCFAILDSRWFCKIVLVAIIVHTCLIFFEPPPVDGTSPAVFTLTAVCLLVYLIDVLLNITFLTWPVFWSIPENRWMRVEFVFLCMFTVDFIFLIIQESIEMRLAQPFRCLRAALLLCKLKNVGHIYDVVLSIAVKMATIFFIIALFIILYASVGLHVFVVDYHYIGCNNTGLVNCSEDATNIYTGAFDHIGIASLRLFVLLTTENYPDFIFPSYAKSQYSFIYFGIFIYVGVFILLAIMLAVIVDGYWVFAKKHVKLERSRERAELAKAWNLLDPLGAGILERSDPKFLTLFKLLRPKNTDDMNLKLIEYLDADEDGYIDSFEWTTRLNETLSFEIEEDDITPQSMQPRCFQVITDGAHRLVNWKVFSIAILTLIIVHSILFCVRWWGMTYTQELIVQAIRTVIVSVFVIEIMLRVIGEGRNILQILEILDLVLVVIAFVANIVWYVVSDNTVHRGGCVVASSLAVCLRMGFNSAQTKRLVSLLMKIFPVMFDLTVLVIIIFYFFAVLGWELFFSSTPDTSYVTDYYQYNCGLGFQSFPCSLLVTFQVMTTSNWHEIMNAAMVSTSEWACLYFITCFFVLELMVMNIFVAIAIEAFNKLGTEKELQQMIQGDDVSTDGKDKGTLASTAKNFISDMFESSRHEPERKAVATRRGSHISAVSSLHISEKGSNINVDPEEGKDDFSDLPALQRREKMLKQKMAQRKKKHAKSALTKIVVMTAFKADRDNEIDLNVGEEVNVIEKRNDWWLGSVGEKTGWLPASHVREMKRTHSMDESDAAGRGSSKPAWNNRNSEKSDQKKTESKGEGKGGDHTSFHNAALAATATTHLQVQHQASPQQPKLKIKRRETDWRKSILGDITVMNPEEVRELNKIMKSELKYRGKMSSSGESSGSLPGTLKFGSTLDGSIQEEEGEAEAARLNLTAPGQIRSEKVPSISLDKVDEGQGEKGKEKSGQKEMPSWMMKFAETHNINVTEDVKIEKPNEQSEEQSLPGKPNIQTTEL